ncbi:NUDIX hydrolase [Maridesulfovibrio hydrothermalis]|uniref:NUDIX hydrolase n=1 Tax=Maridesulfovibrio hydrothermalis AM13 = DSM 14728 TaxID=1121451 RepID=L0RG96_9BACT|nr:NUDIX domain-containing protein [Maridesulfovibrio hydrothermalis]CCO24586.1 NUDIX hydrolase [Maridesulfovibrio hydrothermalis AM13 = DSM 14728]
MKKNIIQVEAVDKNNRPIIVMDIDEVHRQSLRHRSVVVLIYNSEGKLYLQKRSANKTLYSGRWNVSASGHVLSGESLENAALRELKNELGLVNGNIRLLDEIEASSETGYEFITVYVLDKINTIPAPNPEEVESGFYYSESELYWMIREYRELLAPGLVFLYDSGILYRTK